MTRYFACCEHCAAQIQWGHGESVDEHTVPCPDGCNDVQAEAERPAGKVRP